MLGGEGDDVVELLATTFMSNIADTMNPGVDSMSFSPFKEGASRRSGVSIGVDDEKFQSGPGPENGGRQETTCREASP